MSLPTDDHLGVDRQEHREQDGADSRVDQVHDLAVEEDHEESEEKETERDDNGDSEPLGEVVFRLEREDTHRQSHSSGYSERHEDGVQVIVAGYDSDHVGESQSENHEESDISRELSSESLTTHQHEVRYKKDHIADIVQGRILTYKCLD